MSQYRKLHRLLIIAISLVIGTSIGWARPATIEDNGAFFSEQAKAEAARNIADLETSTKKDLAIETFQELPDDVKAGVNLEDKAAVNRAIEQWAARQAKTRGVNGIYILLVKSPAYLRVMVGNDTQRRVFTLQDRDTLVGKMLVKLRAKDYDDALLDAVNFVSVTMRANGAGGKVADSRNSAAPAPASGSSFSILSVLVVVLVIWVVIGIFRAITRSGSGLSPAAGGGGGFLGSLMGGLFGAAAGMWMYDHFLGGNSSASDAGHNNLDNSDSEISGQDTDYSGSGDSFGGGDDGGGDSGGGDF